MTLSEYLRDAKKTPSEFAEDLGMPPSTILRILSGKRQARLLTATRIVSATGGKVTYADLAQIAKHVGETERASA